MSASVIQPNRDGLARLLAAAGSAYEPEMVEALIEGVLAAPAEIGTGWHVLVADPMPRQLAGCLEALRAAKAAEYHDGLSRDDFARLPRSERLSSLRKELASQGLDGVGHSQPAAPIAPAVPHPERFSGESAESKRTRLGRALQQEGVAAVVLTMPESIAWLLNIRGGDVPHTPLPLSFAILRRDGSVNLFIDRRKLAPGLDRHLGNAVTIETPDRLGLALDELARSGQRVHVDPATAASWIF